MRSGSWSRSEIASRIEDAGREQAHPLRVELEALGHLRDGRGGEHADAALERLVLQLRSHQPAQRGGRAADRDGAGGRRRLEALEGPLHVAAHLLQLVSRGRVGAQVGVGQKARADPERLRPRHLAVRLAYGDLAGAAADVDHRDRAVGRPQHRASGANERQPRLLLARQDARARCRRPSPRRPAARSRLGALRMAAVATATICSAPTSRATLAWVRTTSAVSAIFSRRDRAAVQAGSSRCA